MRSRWIVVAVAAGLLAVPLGAMAATTTVTMANYSFSPQSATVTMGSTVTWNNTAAATSHTATQDGDLHLWDTGTVGAGSSSSKVIRFAGSYPYHCAFHQGLGMVGTVKVPIKVGPTSGTTSTHFTVTLATVDAPSAFVYDVQRRIGSSGKWTSWRTGITTASVHYTPSATGTYYFRSRLRRVSNSGTSDWSPARKITVS